MSTMASLITSVSIVAQPFVQAQIKENIKAPRHCMATENGDLWIPHTKGQQRAENVSICWRHHVSYVSAFAKRYGLRCEVVNRAAFMTLSVAYISIA